MSDRGMKKWAPFSSLIEQSVCLEKMRYERNKIEKPKISSDRANEINRILLNYHGQLVKITYFYDGYLYEIKTIIVRVNRALKELETKDGSIALSNIINLTDGEEFY